MTKLKTAGFTLIEVIITVVVIAIVGAMLFSVMGTSMTRSSDPIFRMQTSFSLQQVMENMMIAYEKDYALEDNALQKFSDSLSKYCSETVKCEIVGEQTGFIKYDSNKKAQPAEDTDSKTLFKVTIKNDNNETLTYVFVG